MESSPKTRFLLLLILCFSAFWLLRNISQPWNGLDATDGALKSAVARNYLRHGIWSIHLGQAINPEQVSNLSELSFYQHHPPLLPLLLTASFTVLGESEAAARVVSIVLMLGSVILVFALSSKIYGERVAIMAAFVFGTLPVVLFFGRTPCYEVPSLFFILLSLWFYLQFLESRCKTHLVGLYLSLGFGLLMDWPVYLLAPLLSLHYWIYAKDAPLRKTVVFGLPFFALVMFGLFEFQSYLVQPDSFQDLLNQGKAYMGLIPKDSPLVAKYKEAKVTFTILEYTKTVANRLDILFSYPILILSLIGLWTLLKERTARSISVLLLLGVGLAYCVLFYRSVYIHVWHTYYLAAPIAILAALGASTALSKNETNVPVQQNSSFGWSTPAIFLLVALAIVGGIPRLKSLHEIQVKLLPGDQHEQATFLKSVATNVRAKTSGQDIILTNLPKGSRSSTAFAYYVERKIVWNMDSVSVLYDFFKEPLRAGPVHFLMWRGPEISDDVDALYRWLLERGKVTEFVVQGHRFLWFTLSADVSDQVEGGR